MENKEMKTIQFPNSETVYEIVDNAAREALAGKQPSGDYATKTELAEGLAGKQPTGDYATKTELTEGLAEKQPVGDYATNTALTEGLASKQPMGDYATNTALAEGLAQKQPTGDYALKSELPDVSQFITKAVNDLVYYYTKTQVDNMVSEIPKFSIKVVDALPYEQISSTTVYLLRNDGSAGNLYTEYIYVDGAWEPLGTQTVDLSGYVTTEALNSAIADFVTAEYVSTALAKYVTSETFTAHTGNTNNPHGVTAAQTGAYTKPSTGIPETDLAQDVQDKLNGGGGGSLNIVDLGTFSATDTEGSEFSATVSEENYAALSTPGTVVKATIDGGLAEFYFVLSKSMTGESSFSYISTTGAAVNDQLTIFSIAINEDKTATIVPQFVPSDDSGNYPIYVYLGQLQEDTSSQDGSYVSTVTADLYDSLILRTNIVRADLPNGRGEFYGLLSRYTDGYGGISYTATSTVVVDGQLTVFTLTINNLYEVRLTPIAISNGGSSGDVEFATNATNLVPDENGAVNPGGRGSGTVGIESTALGYNASAVEFGSTALGTGASASEINSTALGRSASAAGTGSTALGYSASAAGGIGSTALGYSASATGHYSIALGYSASAGSSSTALGYSASAGSSSTALGYSASASGSYSTALGHYATASELDSNVIQLGSSSSLSTLRCRVNLTVTSDKRDKADINNITNALSFIEKLNPVTFVSNDRANYISEEDKQSENYRKYGMCDYDRVSHALGTKKGGRRRCGLLAQEVIVAMQEIYGTDNYANIVNDNFHDLTEKPSDVENKYTLAYANLVPFLIGAIKELNAKIKELEDK